MYYLWQQTSSYAALVQPTSLQGDAVPVFAGSLVVLLLTFLPRSAGARVTSVPPVQTKNEFTNLLLQVSGVSRLPLTAAGEEAPMPADRSPVLGTADVMSEVGV